MNKIVKNDDGARVLYFFLYFSSFFNATHLGRFLAFHSCRKPRMNFFFKEQNQNIKKNKKNIELLELKFLRLI